MTAKEIREKRAALAKRMREMTDKIHADKRDFNAEEEKNWQDANKDYDALGVQLERMEKLEKIEADQAATRDANPPGREDRDTREQRGAGNDDRRETTAPTEETRSHAFSAWARTQLGLDVTEQQEAACRQLRFNPSRQFIDIPLARTADYRQLQADVRAGRVGQDGRPVDGREARAMSSVAGPTGAYTIVPETLVRSLEVNMLYFGGVRQVAETIRTTTGEPMGWPTADDTSNTGAQLGENTTIGSSVEPSFGKIAWNAYKFSSKPILVPFELLQDSAFDLASLLGQMLGERLGRITNTKFTTGTAAGTCNGIVTAASLGKTTASATAITADEIIDLTGSVDVAYRTPGCGFMMHDQILMYVRKLKSASNEYIWTPSFAGGITGPIPDRLFNYPYTINNDMTGTTSGAIVTATKTMLFGQLNKYKIRTVGSVRLYRLEERYRDTDQDGFIAFTREDGNLLTGGTAPVKYMLQA